MDRTKVKPYEDISRKIYAYTLPQVPDHDGYIKVGETIQETEERIKSQVSTAGLIADLLFTRIAKTYNGKWFHDTELHRYFEQNGIERANFNDSAKEWFFFNSYPQKAEQLTDKFIHQDYAGVQTDDEQYDYKLRQEQQEAVDATLYYYKTGDDERHEFLWNAKPRFGKTLATYDFIRKINATNVAKNVDTNVLVVTNRPAIANSWFDDFKKFISWQETNFRFISETDALKNKAMSRAEFLNEVQAKDNELLTQITFISLQDLKGAKFADGKHDKLEWVGVLHWDLLVIDEAHEGVDTAKTDRAFDKIIRDFTLHLSGTPFKALANNKFNDNQIYNWSYVDEQKSKNNWDYAYGSNPYESLPTLNMFTYQMSIMVEEEISQGKTIGEENYDYAFDLNEFFKVSDGETFDHVEDVQKFLDNLASGRFPFSETEHRQELNHTLWLLSRVDSAKALERMLKAHPVFSKYAIVLAAGDGKSLPDVDESIETEAHDFKSNEKSYDRVKKAIRENDRTITLSVGQLTTGVTISEWTGILMLSNIKSPSLYFQAAFRAQNPHEYTDETGHLQRKENAYIFDFAPERTLVLFDEFANNLSGNPTQTTEERKDNIRELLNFFPVIAEDQDGSMYELDTGDVLTIPNRIKAAEVVKRGFMSNLLFANISGIFSAPSEIKEILEKIKPEKNKRLGDRREINNTKPIVNEKGEVDISNEIIISQTEKLFGKEIYADEFKKDVVETEKLVNDIMKSTVEGFKKLADEYQLNDVQLNEKKKFVEDNLKKHIYILKEELETEQKAIEEKYRDDLATANEAEAKQIQEEIEHKKTETTNRFFEDLHSTTNKELISIVEDSAIQVEEEKKKTTEDDVRDHLRGFSRTIPTFLMAYGDKDTNVDNFEENIEPNTFYELTSITIGEFQKLRDGFDYIDDEGNTKTFMGLFNKSVFNASIGEFFNKKEELSNYFDKTIDEDIFDYIPPQETNQIYTPKAVVKKMVDILQNENPKIFIDPNIKFIDLYTKSGLFITEIVTKLFEGLKEQIPDKNARLKWIIENQVYAVAPSNIICNIAKNFIMGNFEGISDKNIVEYDLTEAAEEGNITERLNELYGDENMKFDVVIGNPPYQETLKDTSDKPVYNFFMEEAYKLAHKVMFITPGRFLFNAGKTPKSWNQKMLNDKHIKVVHYEAKSSIIFPNTDIMGGIAVTYRDVNKNFGEIKTFTPFNELTNVLRKVITYSNFSSLKQLIYTQNKFNLKALYKDYPEYKSIIGSNGREKRLTTSIFEQLDILTENSKSQEKARILGLINNKRLYRYIDIKYLAPHENLSEYKVILPKSNGSDAIGGGEETVLIGQPDLGKPNTGYTQSFIGIGAFDTESEAKSLLKYVKTKFARAMLGTLKVTQDNNRETWDNVPLQDFTPNSDIDWTKSISEIDRQLYSKYGLTEYEIKFIESKIKEMK